MNIIFPGCDDVCYVKGSASRDHRNNNYNGSESRISDIRYENIGGATVDVGYQVFTILSMRGGW